MWGHTCSGSWEHLDLRGYYSGVSSTFGRFFHRQPGGLPCRGDQQSSYAATAPTTSISACTHRTPPGAEGVVQPPTYCSARCAQIPETRPLEPEGRRAYLVDSIGSFDSSTGIPLALGLVTSARVRAPGTRCGPGLPGGRRHCRGTGACSRPQRRGWGPRRPTHRGHRHNGLPHTFGKYVKFKDEPGGTAFNGSSIRQVENNVCLIDTKDL